MIFALFLVIVLVVAYRSTKPDERKKIARMLLARGRELRAATHRPDLDEFQKALCARNPGAIGTVAIAALNIAVFAFMLLGAGSLGDPATLVSWGGSFGPRTTNGEWWRLATSMFVHSGLLHLCIDMIGLVQVGLILERLIGTVVFVAIYVAAGLLAALVGLAISPVSVSIGASGAFFGVYGLLAAWVVAGLFQQSPLTIPMRALQRIAPAAGAFILYTVLFGSVTASANITGFLTGLVYGLGMAIGVSDRTPARRITAATFATLAIAVAGAVPLRGMADIRPELARIVALEHRTVTAYEDVVHGARNHQLDTERLTKLINTSIIPDLKAARAHLHTIDRVPQEHQPLVAAADDYLRLRLESWRLRAEGLSRTNMLKLRQSERAERDSFDALEKIKPADEQQTSTPPIETAGSGR